MTSSLIPASPPADTFFRQSYSWRDSSAQAFWPVSTREGDVLVVFVADRENEYIQTGCHFLDSALTDLSEAQRESLCCAIVRVRSRSKPGPQRLALVQLPHYSWFYSDAKYLGRMLEFTPTSLSRAACPEELVRAGTWTQPE